MTLGGQRLAKYKNSTQKIKRYKLDYINVKIFYSLKDTSKSWKVKSLRDVCRTCNKGIIYRIGEGLFVSIRKRQSNFKSGARDFSGGPVVENLPSNAGDTGSISVRKLWSHML